MPKALSFEPREPVSMQYEQGRWGRIFFVRIDHGEDLLQTIAQFVTEMQISHGLIQFLGALREGTMVSGPRHLTLPPEPLYGTYEGGFDTFGMATIYPSATGPRIHVHGSIGREGVAMTGCLRERAITYIVIEAVVMEIKGFSAVVRHDARTGLELPFPGNDPE